MPLSEPSYLPYQYIPNEPKKVLTREQIKYIEDNILAPYVFKLNKTVMSGSLPDITTMKKDIHDDLLAKLTPILNGNKIDVDTQIKAIDALLKRNYLDLQTQYQALKTQFDGLPISSGGISATFQNQIDAQQTLLNQNEHKIEQLVQQSQAQIGTLTQALNDQTKLTLEQQTTRAQISADIVTLNQYKKDTGLLISKNKTEKKNLEAIKKTTIEELNQQEALNKLLILRRNEITDLLQQSKTEVNAQIIALGQARAALDESTRKASDVLLQLTQPISHKKSDELNLVNAEKINTMIESIVTPKIDQINTEISQVKLTIPDNIDITHRVEALEQNHNILSLANKELDKKNVSHNTRLNSLEEEIHELNYTIQKLNLEYSQLLIQQKDLQKNIDTAITDMNSDIKTEIAKMKNELEKKITEVINSDIPLQEKLNKINDINKSNTELLSKYKMIEKTITQISDEITRVPGMIQTQVDRIMPRLIELINSNVAAIKTPLSELCDIFLNLITNLSNMDDITMFHKQLQENQTHIQDLVRDLKKVP